MQHTALEHHDVPRSIDEAVNQLAHCLEHSKCWSCGCFHDAVKSLERAFPFEPRPRSVDELIGQAAIVLTAPQYDCKGCEVCYPAVSANLMNEANPDLAARLSPCEEELSVERHGWPPLAGEYEVVRYQAPVAVCTLNDNDLALELSRIGSSPISIVGPLSTENLGIERVISNVIANPHIRFLVLCGTDSEQSVGHLPGQSLLALAANGVDERMRIQGARGKRPVLRNISAEAVEHFRRTVQVSDLVKTVEVSRILDAAKACATKNPGPVDAFEFEPSVTTVNGHIPERMIPDPAGYFVIHLDRERNRILLEHYGNDGVIDFVVTGRSAAELYTPVIGRNLLSRLDHAAYLGMELSRAEHAIRTGEPFVQDRAPERLKKPTTTNCTCESC